ncbi:vacuolar protein sorting-associated protein 8 homolog [Plodia interpunctella]|uniref:vacuolar protein sorting-associated protein 8 homolog n=1 Tax=Plodia interpunctella TaxID=58824 RepID=UPI002367F494|nr:vacuolar protein sorting-associated protein 8 homolog [Plodia interpunctella]XP_053606904.1 vacuolar protein sorting-associated protein 8 homolog [Plodia interpunctella]XP_053606905.1 vacuolar protein sorting-associated protein 8 homolog [Plodia interpunctella]XP_053606906.1 vacuolar protein sorting-associated protein 8 homolog [Plodia interpunctella]
MDLLKAPSVQSLLDSDLESVESLQYLDIEELDEVEYALPASEAPTLAEVLLDEVEDGQEPPAELLKPTDESGACSALQVELLQAVSQQLVQAQDRSSTGVVTSLSVAKDGRLTVGTAHGHLLTFFEQILRWVCNSNSDRGAVSCLSYNSDGTRLLAGFARGLICQYESIKGILLRRVTLGGEIWGILRVTWAGMSGLALDTGGSVWLIKFSRPLGVRSARTSCLFSGARGEVVAMKARDARILALATLSRVIIVAGGRAAGVRLGGPPDTLPVLEWCESDNRILVCARSKTLQWISVNVTGSSITLRPLKRVELKTTPLWLGWIGGSLAIFDSDENLRLWGDDYDKPLDLSHIEPVYASAFFKGLWTDGLVSSAMRSAGVSALGGACVRAGALSLLGRRGVVRVRVRDVCARAHAALRAAHHSHALRLLALADGPEAETLARDFVDYLSQRPHLLANKSVADQVIELCLKFHLSEELWSNLWEQCSSEKAFVEALGDAAVMCKLTNMPPSPDSTQALIERLAECEPALVERVLASLPLTALDPHRASVFCRQRGLWRAVGAVAAALGGSCGAMRELVQHVSAECGRARASCGCACACAGDALVLACADALAGRGAGGRPLPEHKRPSARHDALQTLLAETGAHGRSPLQTAVQHDADAAMRLLQQSARDPPFTGPLGKQNRLRVARALLAFIPQLQDSEAVLQVLEFVTSQLRSGALPGDAALAAAARAAARAAAGERADRALLTLLLLHLPSLHDIDELQGRPRVLWRLEAQLGQHKRALEHFFQIVEPSAVDIDELFDYVRTRAADDGQLFATFSHDDRCDLFRSLVELRPRAAAELIEDDESDYVVPVLNVMSGERVLEFADCLLKLGRLRGDAAAAHLRNMCKSNSGGVKEFLIQNPGIVRPEDALAIVREMKVEDAEATCLEAVGDCEGALESLLRRLEGSEAESAAEVAGEAGALCARAAASVPRAAAAAMWERLLQRAPGLPPALLLEAVPYLPVQSLLGRTCASPRAALALAACAGTRRRGWQCAARIAGREAHEALARALAAAGRGLPVRGRCVRCGRRLALAATRTQHCARAVHAACAPEPACAACGARVPAEVAVLPTRAPRRVSPPPDNSLLLVAPPRPDLEGVV